jgi:hypothetical protein
MITAEFYHCGTHEAARAVRDQLKADGWIDVEARGPIVYYPSTSGNDDARGFVAVVAATVSGRAS